MQTRIATVLVITGTFLTAGVVRAQDIAAGQEVARVWCSGCHYVGGRQPKAGIGAAPPFSSIAQMNSTTTMSIAAFLSTPHERMPNYTLSQKEIQDVSAYIISLRGSL